MSSSRAPAPPLSEPVRSLGDLRCRLGLEIESLDLAISGGVMGTPTPTLDKAMVWLSNAANNSKLWLAAAAALALTGGRGRRAAAQALTTVGLTSVTVNVVVKKAFPRHRPDRLGTKADGGVQMPTSSSFPSGHTASAFAFATVVSVDLPQLSLPMYGLATAVGWSRVHTGVHYPSDVLAGGAIGLVIGSSVQAILQRHPGLARRYL